MGSVTKALVGETVRVSPYGLRTDPCPFLLLQPTTSLAAKLIRPYFCSFWSPEGAPLFRPTAEEETRGAPAQGSSQR